MGRDNGNIPEGNYSLTLPRHLAEKLAEYQARFTPEDSDGELIEQFLKDTEERFVCVSMLAYEALHYSEYDRVKNNERHRIAETMRTMKGWEPAGMQRFARYGSQRAWKRVGASRENDFTPVPEQMVLPFTENS